MLKSFLSINASAESFDRFLISKDVDFVKKHCGQYPVVFLDLKDCKGENWEEMYHNIWECISLMVARHKIELAEEIAKWKMYGYDFDSLNPPVNGGALPSIPQRLIKSLYEFHGKRVIVLIDEYDAPLNHAFRKGYYKEASNFFGQFYSKALKGNSALAKACLMGIVEVRGAGILSGLNNISVYSVADTNFSSSFGFSKAEIECLDISATDLENVCDWYNGYSIGDFQVINPWSFMKWWTRKKFDLYWVKTSYLETISAIISPNMNQMIFPVFEILSKKKKKFEIAPLDTKVDYSTKNWDRDSIFHFLVHTGYLTYSVENEKSFVSIPNDELHMYWEKDVIPLLKSKFDFNLPFELSEALLNFKTDQIEILMKQVLLKASYFDFPSYHEKSYHMLYFGCFFTTFYGTEDMIVSSNKESGHGRYDIRIEFGKFKKAIVFEFKKSISKDSLEMDAEKALDQIIERKYADDLSNCQCLFVGAAFYRKEMSSLKFKELQN